jgi:hypothetical protein
MADKTILDLTTESDRPVVKIDGVGYPLRTSNDLTLEQYRFLERVSIRVADLLQRSSTLTKVENAELNTRLKEVAKVALEAPAAVLGKLTPIHRVMIFKVFSELLTPTLIQAIRAMGTDQTLAAAALRSHGKKQSPGSYASMAGLLKPGRRGRRRG